MIKVKTRYHEKMKSYSYRLYDTHIKMHTSFPEILDNKAYGEKLEFEYVDMGQQLIHRFLLHLIEKSERYYGVDKKWCPVLNEAIKAGGATNYIDSLRS